MSKFRTLGGRMSLEGYVREKKRRGLNYPFQCVECVYAATTFPRVS